jgi:hypothetical protein
MVVPYVAPAGGDEVSPPDLPLGWPQPMPQTRLGNNRLAILANQKTIPLLVLSSAKGPQVNAPTGSQRENINLGRNGSAILSQHLGQIFGT